MKISLPILVYFTNLISSVVALHFMLHL